MSERKPIRVQVMSIEDWIGVKDNPIQRDTERHAARAKHLHKPKPTHYVSHAAELPNGTLLKLDGHTRAYLWKLGVVPKLQNNVTVLVYAVNDAEGAADLYKDFDSKEALETTPDKVSGAFHGMGYKPESGLVQSGAISHSLRLAWIGVYGYGREQRYNDIYEVITEFAAEILFLDSLNLRKGQLPGGVIAAVLLSFRKYGDKIRPFWRAVVANQGKKSGGRMDGIQAINEIVIGRRNNAGHSAALDTLGRALTAVERYMADETLTNIPRPMDVTGYLEAKQRPSKYKLVKRAPRLGTNGNGVHASA